MDRPQVFAHHLLAVANLIQRVGNDGGVQFEFDEAEQVQIADILLGINGYSGVRGGHTLFEDMMSRVGGQPLSSDCPITWTKHRGPIALCPPIWTALSFRRRGARPL